MLSHLYESLSSSNAGYFDIARGMISASFMAAKPISFRFGQFNSLHICLRRTPSSPRHYYNDMLAAYHSHWLRSPQKPQQGVLDYFKISCLIGIESNDFITLSGRQMKVGSMGN